jgi:hypothetical protein
VSINAAVNNSFDLSMRTTGLAPAASCEARLRSTTGPRLRALENNQARHQNTCLPPLPRGIGTKPGLLAGCLVQIQDATLATTELSMIAGALPHWKVRLDSAAHKGQATKTDRG